jgi:hypothetical protein
MHSDLRLEGALVRGEAGVAVYPEEQAACRARVGDETRAEPVRVRLEAANEQQRPSFLYGDIILFDVA